MRTLEEQMVIEKFAHHRLNGKTFDEIMKALSEDEELDNDVIAKVLEEAVNYKK